MINLERRRDRWAAVARRLKALEAFVALRVERLRATDGLLEAVPSELVTESWETTRNAQFDGRRGYRGGVRLEMTKGERGCAMSHLRAWREVAKGSSPVLIMEAGHRDAFTFSFKDDAVPTANFPQRPTSK